jgi:hypothetical protein
MNGWGKAGWTIVLIILPFLGVLIYVIANGRSMSERQIARERQSQAAFREYARDTAETSGPTDDLVKLAKLKDDGFITSEEYESAKAKVLH